MTKNYLHWGALFTVMMVFSCGPREKPKGIEPGLRQVPQSNVNLAIKLPISAMEEGINKSLSKDLAKETILLNDRNDKLFLDIKRAGEIKLAYKNNQFYASIPLKVSVVVQKKVLGLLLTNKDQPVVFWANANISGPFDLDQKWNPIYDFAWRSIEWEKPPIFEVLGLKLDLTETIEKQIKKAVPLINKKINLALSQGVRLDDHINNAFNKIQDPIKVKLNDDNFFLHLQVQEIKGSLIKESDDTLGLAIASTSDFSLHEKRPATSKVELPEREEFVMQNEAFTLFIDAPVSFALLNEKAAALTSQRFEFEGNTITLDEADFYSEDGYINCKATFSGDRQGVIHFYGVPALDDKLNVYIEQFGYELLSADDWLALTDATLHRSFEKILEEALSYNLDSQIDQLEQSIIRAVEESPSGDKFDLGISIQDISLHELGLTKEEIQFVVKLTGKAEIILEKGVFSNP
jgi:hypothetical protein